MSNGLFPTITKDKPSKSRILELVRVGLYTFCFIGIIVHFNEHENVIYETSKAAQRDIAMLFFIGIMFVMQRIRLINWQSLLVTIVFAPFAVLGVTRFSQSPDLIPPAIMEQIALWLELLLITDMAITKRVRKLKDMNWAMFLLLGSVIVLLFILRSSGNPAPVTLLAFLLFCLIPADRDELNHVLCGLLNAGFLCFIQAMIVSEVVNPIDFTGGNGNRWYGYFLTLGTFGQYLGIQTVFAIGSIYLAKKRRGRLNPFYFISFLWLLTVLAAAFFCGVTNYLVGAFFLCATLFVFGFGKKKEGYFIRGLIVLILITVGGIFLLDFIRYLVNGYNQEEFLRFIDNSPLKVLSGTAHVLATKLENAHQFKSIYFHGMSISSSFIESPLLMLMNSLGSGRIFIWREYLKNTSFMGNSGELPVADIVALHAHNEYIQSLYEFGFAAGAMYIILYLVAYVRSIIGYLKEKSPFFFVSMISLAMMLGMWTGETSSIHFLLTFITTLLMMINVVFMHKKREGRDAEPVAENRGYSKAAISSIIILLILFLGLTGVFGYKLFHDSHDAKQAVNQYLYIKNEEPVNTDTYVLVMGPSIDEFSTEAVCQTLGSPKSVVSDSEIQKVADKASWTDCVFYAFDLPEEYEVGDRILIELTARSTCGEEVPVDLLYYTHKSVLYLHDEPVRYASIITIEDCEQRITLRFPIINDETPEVVMGNIRLTEYGPESNPEDTESSK